MVSRSSQEANIQHKQSMSSDKRSFSINKISVNLLPPEIIFQRNQKFKLGVVNKISIGILVVMVFVTSATIALKVMQSAELSNSQKNLAYAEDKVTGLKTKEGQIVMLKERLSSIQSLSKGDEKIKAVFNLVLFLTPAEIQISELSVDKNGNMSIALNGSSLQAIEVLIGNLGDKEKNLDMISKVDLDGLSLGRDSIYRFALKITPKK